MLDILALLKDLELIEGRGFDMCRSRECPACGGEVLQSEEEAAIPSAHHEPRCELKAAIDSLESGRVRVVENEKV